MPKFLQRLYQRLARIFSPRTRAILIASLLASIFVFALSVIRLFNVVQLDDRVESRSINYMKNFVPYGRFDRSKIKIIVIPDLKAGAAPWGDIDRKHREFFVSLVTAMRAAKAKVLAFDVAFEAPFDPAFSSAIEGGPDGLRVVVGVDSYERGKTDPELPTGVKEPRWGTIDVGGTQEEDGPIRSIKLADENLPDGDSGKSEQTVIPSLAIRVVSEYYDPQLTPVFDRYQNKLVLYWDSARTNVFRSIPLDRQTDLLIQHAKRQDLDLATVRAQAVFDSLQDIKRLETDYGGKIVLVGYENGELKDLLGGDQRLGVELHATAISNILNGVFIYKLSPFYNYLVILIMCLVAASLFTPPGKPLDYKIPIPIPWTKVSIPIPVGLLIIGGLYLLAAFLLYRRAMIYLDLCYHLTALFINHALISFVLKKKFPSRSALEAL